MKLYRNKLIIILLITQAIFVSNFAFSADAHYAKILELNKQIVPNMPSRDKLKLHFQILDEVAKIPTDAKYFIKEINEVLDITLRIVEKNQGILRHEECITSLLGISKTNLKDKDIRKKLMSIATKNIRYRANGNFKNYIKVYTHLLDILYKQKFYIDFLEILKHINEVLNPNRKHSKQYYLIFDEFFEKYKNTDSITEKFDRNIENFFRKIACIFHFKDYNLASKIFIYYEKKYINKTNSLDKQIRITYILYQAIHFIGIADEAKTQELYSKILFIKKNAKEQRVIEKAEQAIKRIKLNIQNFAKDKIKLK